MGVHQYKTSFGLVSLRSVKSSKDFFFKSFFFSLCGTSYKKSSYKKEIPIDLEIISPLWWYTSWFYACFGYLPHFWIVWPVHFSEKVNSKQIQNQIQFPVYHGTAVYTTVPVSIMVLLYVYTVRPCTLEYNLQIQHAKARTEAGYLPLGRGTKFKNPWLNLYSCREISVPY